MSQTSSTEQPLPASIISHVSIGTNRFEEASQFYDRVLATLSIERVLVFPNVVAYGRTTPEFWVHPAHDGKPATVGNGSHFAFMTQSPEEVDPFYQEALAAGATSEGEPGPRPLYGEAYYGAFMRDLDGHKIEAMFWDMTKMGHEQS